MIFVKDFWGTGAPRMIRIETPSRRILLILRERLASVAGLCSMNEGSQGFPVGGWFNV